MLVPEEYIVEEIDIDERELERDPPGVHLRYNHTEPSVISDGVDFIAVIEQGGDEYRIDYWGYAFGRMYITSEGVQELGQRLAYEDDEIPSWTLDPETVDAYNPPWRLPHDVAIDPLLLVNTVRRPFRCERSSLHGNRQWAWRGLSSVVIAGNSID